LLGSQFLRRNNEKIYVGNRTIYLKL
jgi:hypothetical protein